MSGVITSHVKQYRRRGLASRIENTPCQQVKYITNIIGNENNSKLLPKPDSFSLLNEVLESFSNSSNQRIRENIIKKNISSQEANGYKELPWIMTNNAISKCNQLIENNSIELGRKKVVNTISSVATNESLIIYRNLFSVSPPSTASNKYLYRNNNISNKNSIIKSKILSLCINQFDNNIDGNINLNLSESEIQSNYEKKDKKNSNENDIQEIMNENDNNLIIDKDESKNNKNIIKKKLNTKLDNNLNNHENKENIDNVNTSSLVNDSKVSLFEIEDKSKNTSLSMSSGKRPRRKVRDQTDSNILIFTTSSSSDDENESKIKPQKKKKKSNPDHLDNNNTSVEFESMKINKEVDRNEPFLSIKNKVETIKKIKLNPKKIINYNLIHDSSKSFTKNENKELNNEEKINKNNKEIKTIEKPLLFETIKRGGGNINSKKRNEELPPTLQIVKKEEIELAFLHSRLNNSKAINTKKNTLNITKDLSDDKTKALRDSRLNLESASSKVDLRKKIRNPNSFI